MNLADSQKLIHQTEYAKKLRPLLPPEAFLPDSSKLVILLINVAILILGWSIARQLDRWPLYLLWLYLPLAVVMGNSVMVLISGSHDLIHGSVTKNNYLIRVISLLGLALGWMPPTLWKVLHNRMHHNTTNSLADPDRSYLYEQPKTWAKWIQNLLVPSDEVNPIGLTLGMITAWGVYTFRNLTAVLLFNREVDYVPASFKVSAKERLGIAGEFLAILTIHVSILTYLQFEPIKLLFSYFLPIAIGYGIWIFYIYTNHLLCRITSVNDPLLNTISIRVPKLVALLHFNCCYHTEHHIFPGMNSDYYPMVQDLLKIHYPERFNLLDSGDVWRLLMQTPRYYKDENTFTNWLGEKTVSCPLNRM
ncbi:MAG: fatty acid desaturase [Richelia sp. RM2_1_2]|nr:fatty acid desaturase [Richelia sp. SL_2_1]NJO59386.1 fatty acid desaturase [Richelia sp. RM2_1_2]